MIIVRDESARLSLGMVASPQSPLPFTLTIYLSVGMRFDLSCTFVARGVFPLPPRGFEFVIAFGVNLFLAALQHGLGRDIADGAVQSLFVVNLNILRDQTN